MITPLTDALAERGFDTLTPVQEAVIAPELASSDLLVSAQTGSGKTVGFGLAIAPTLLGEEDRFGPAAAPLALIIAPTRELAFQVMRELSWLYAKTGAVVASCVGGMDTRTERRALERGAHIVVGTPGRLRDHIERGALDLGELRAVVLDEADEMLDLGFREDLEFMLGEAPEDRRTLLFSATVPPMIVKLAQQYQRDAQRVSTLSTTDQHADISYQALRVADADRDHAIFNLLRFHGDQSAIVFANTRAAVNHLTARMANRGLATVSLSGELSQAERSHALQAMRDGRARVCVATDVAARGIDLPNLSLVIHAELPSNTESLLHRSGRTGRAGRKGMSALIVPPKAVKKAERLLKWAKITAEWTLPPSAEDVRRKDEERLLSDPLWDDAPSEEEAAFAERLLALHSPDRIAAAYLRLYQTRHAAPEELMSPDAAPARREKREFGPSRWVKLSVGRNERAEARWLLPLLCRAGNLDKSAIGAIRVQDAETYVELAEARVDGFLSSLGAEGTLEDGITVQPMDGAPEWTPQPRGGKPGGDRPRKPREAQTSERPQRAARPPKPEGVADAPRHATPTEPREERNPPRADSFKPARKPREESPVPADRPRPRRDDRSDSDAPHRKAGPGKPKGKGAPYKAQDGKPKGKGAPYKAYDGKPKGKGAPSKAQDGKPGQKPGKPMGKPKAAPTDARDSSKRFTPPGQKPSARKPRKPGAPRPGGNDAPRRKP
ncbi:DEAD/DEAH box helicase [Salipiger sp. P9]|uniref:DEAD/DEAH box helicase n=1 Tax=Salipiger pentaromativorans TaxID=2943193 RepID=UPI0021584F3B|nr:DEAD/DEAH box helicase [Salipiger pentaromativorans]MCR8548991.1 DEAD/DEAH box helicase [Salipiger pentaromativorans]